MLFSLGRLEGRDVLSCGLATHYFSSKVMLMLAMLLQMLMLMLLKLLQMMNAMMMQLINIVADTDAVMPREKLMLILMQELNIK